MKISNRAIVSSVGIVSISLISLLLRNANCLWALLLVMFIVETIED